MARQLAALILLATSLLASEPLINRSSLTLLAAEPAAQVASGRGESAPRQPQAVVDHLGLPHLVFGAGDELKYCRWNPTSHRFDQPLPVATVPNLSLGMRRGPRLAVTPQAVCVTAVGGQQGKGRDGDVLAYRSIDGGQHWDGPVRVNDVADSAREGLHAMTSGPNGALCCIWLDLRNDRTEIHASCSFDNGATWTQNRLVYRSPDKSVCECCHPSIAWAPDGHLYAMWRNSVGGARDMYVASSSDNGLNFNEAAQLGQGTWQLDACPMDGGAIAAVRNVAYSAWRRESSIFLARRPSDPEQFLGQGEQPWLTVVHGQPFVVWLKARGDILWGWSPARPEPFELAQHAFDPVVAASSGGQGPVVVAWETRNGGTWSIEYLLPTLP